MTTKLSINNIFEKLNEFGIKSKETPHCYSVLYHHFCQEDFENIVRIVLLQFPIKPQDDAWMPGTPTGNMDDHGFYICPVDLDQWDEDDFDMFISFGEIHWC